MYIPSFCSFVYHPLEPRQLTISSCPRERLKNWFISVFLKVRFMAYHHSSCDWDVTQTQFPGGSPSRICILTRALGDSCVHNV